MGYKNQDKQIRLLQHWVENSVDLFFWVQEDSRILYVNKAACNLLGYTFEELCNLKVRDFDLEITNNAWPGFTKKLREQKSLCFETRLRKKNGQAFPVEITANILEFEGKDHFFAYGRDITHKKQLDSELQLVKYSIEHSAFPFEWIQDDSRFLYVNEATCRSLGYTREELCSMQVGDIDPDFSYEVWSGFWEKLIAEKSLTFETYHYKKNGEKFPVEIMANYVKFEGKAHVFAYVKDISEKIRAEENHKELEKMLFQAQKMEAIGTLAGGIAHDFNNILGAILGFSEMALDELPVDSSAHADIEKVLIASNRAKDLVKQILTFSRQGEQEIKPLKVQIVLREALSLLRSSIPSTIEIKQDIDPECDVVLADPTQIHQVVMNLCTNAYHAMKETGGKLRVSLQSVELIGDQDSKINLPPGKYIRLEIGDTGHGIKKSDLGKIFDPYFTTKKTGEGTGLGLAVVHGIVTSFNGMIDVSSDLGQGTTFHIYLPVIKEAAEVKQKENNEPLPTGDERILLVDDEEDLVQVNKRILEKLGYNVTAMTKGIDTLHVFQKKPGDFDLVIIDMTMPNLSGEELARHLFSTRPKLPIILCTGFSDKLNTEKVKALGVNHIIMKPVARKELALVVRKALDASCILKKQKDSSKEIN